ncbi:MAG: hypothetical protein DWQ05_15830 [Calditrichaeota bacterium]|nr:MAG: hypothetical protein DWQ05_15830 [Calditrichota bacterium]
MLLVLIILKYLLFLVIGAYLLRLFYVTISNFSEVFVFLHRKEMAVVLWVFIFAFGSLLLYQAYWQLFIGNAYFFATRKLHDPRPWIIEATTIKGTIYDRNHDDSKVLAGYTDATKGELPRRYYPLGEATSHLIGYSDVERDKSGMEKHYFDRLMGRTRSSAAEEDNFINNKYFRVQSVGNDIALTIDYELQKTAYEAFGANKGAVVAIAPATGDVLVLVSAPSFHPDSVSVDAAWARIVADEDGKRLYNRALKGRYPPGSTFKVIVAAAATELGISPVWTLDGRGYRPPGVRRKRVHDHERHSYAERGQRWRGQGQIDLTRALVKSSNAYFAHLGVVVGDSMLHAVAGRFGFNQAVQWNTSRPEFLKSIITMRSSFPETPTAHELAWSSIGQEKVLATPLQLAMIAAAIANDGVLMKPRLELDEPPEEWNRVVSAEAAAKVRKMMREVVWARGGTAWRMRMQEVEVGGKTGTAEINQVVKQDDGTSAVEIVNNAVFISFAPVENPKIAIAVIAEGAGYGGAAAAPVAKQIYLKAHELGYFNDSTDESKKQ